MLRYVVELRGREHAAFDDPRRALSYVESDMATWAPWGGPRSIYSRSDYTIKDISRGRQVLGSTSHGAAILEALP